MRSALPRQLWPLLQGQIIVELLVTDSLKGQNPSATKRVIGGSGRGGMELRNFLSDSSSM